MRPLNPNHNIGNGASRITRNLQLNQQNIPILVYCLLWFTVVGTFILTPYWNGLYFSDTIFDFAAAGTLISSALLLWLLLSKTQIRFKNGFWLSFYPYFILIGTVYVVDTFISPVQKDLAVEGIIRYIALGSVVLALSILLNSNISRKIFLAVLILSGFWVSLFGLANGYGTFHFLGAIMQPDNRLSSVFQYANTNASYSSAILFVALFYYSLIKKPLLKVAISISSYVIMLNLTFTYSRGAWVTFVLLLIIMSLLVSSLVRKDIFYGGLPVILSFILTIKFQLEAIQNTKPVVGWVSLLIGVFLIILFTYGLSRIESRTISIKIPRFFWFSLLAILLILVAIIAFYELHKSNNSIISRLLAINLKQHSVQERLVYYKDGLLLFLKNPVLGGGFGTWTAQFQSIQSFPYWSKHEHSYIIQLLVETGTIGILAFISSIFFYLRSVFLILKTKSDNLIVKENDGIKNDFDEKKLFSLISLFVVASVLLHASIDFDMSYELMGFLLWGMMVLGTFDVQVGQRVDSYRIKPLSTKSVTSYIVVFIVMVSVFITSIKSVASASYYKEAINNQNGPVLALQSLDTALSLASYNSSYALQAAKTADAAFLFLNNQQYAGLAIKYAQDAVRLAPYDPSVLMTSSQILYKYGQANQALDYAQKAYVNGKFGEQYTEQYLVYLVFQSEQNIKSNPKLSKDYAKKAITAWNELKQRVNYVKNLPSYLPPEVRYNITEQMEIRAAEAYLLDGQFNNSQSVVQPLIKDTKDPIIKITAEMVWNELVKQHAVLGDLIVDPQIMQNANVKHEYQMLSEL